MKNRLSDLNNHLFAQLERLSDESVKGDDLKQEIERAKAITTVSREIINGGNLAFKAAQAWSDGNITKAPKMLEIGE